MNAVVSVGAAALVTAAAVAVRGPDRGRWGATVPAGDGTDPPDPGGVAVQLWDAGFGAVWLTDLAWNGGPCGFAEAVVAGAAAPLITVGVWVVGGRDHPVRFAEEFAVTDRLIGGRLRVGLRGPCPAAWANAVAHAWDDGGLDVTLPMRLPARDPANEWIRPDWRLRVGPVPRSPFVWHVPDDSPDLPGVPARRVTRLLAGDVELINGASRSEVVA